MKDSKPARARQIAAIQMGRKRLGLDDEAYRSWLHDLTGKTSAADLNAPERAHVLDAMRRAGHTRPGLPDYDTRNAELDAARRDPDDARGVAPQLVMLRALWRECFDLGVVRSDSDHALTRFAARVTGIHRLEWLTSANITPVIEALKAMRERGVRKQEQVSAS